MYKISFLAELLPIICRYDSTTAIFFFVIHLVLQLSGLTFDSYRANSLMSQHTMVMFVYRFHSLRKRDLFISHILIPSIIDGIAIRILRDSRITLT